MQIRIIPTGPLMVNTYLVSDSDMKKAFIVDPGGYDQRLVDLMQEEELELVYIVLTHSHSDHLGGVEELLKVYPQAKLVCSKAEMDFFGREDGSLFVDEMGVRATLWPDVLVQEGDMITVGGMSFQVLITPGHTPGGLCLVGDGVVFSGDTLFRSSIGRTDFEGGSFEQIIDSIQRKLLTLPEDTVVLPGHMDQTTIEFEKRHNPFV